MSSNSNIFDLYNSNTGIFEFKDGDETKLYLDGTGNVGIGTTNPGVNLHVKNSAVNSNVWLATENDAQQYLVGVRGDTGDNFQIIDNTGGTNSRFDITPSGNIGIGTENPVDLLHIKGNITNISLERIDARRWGIGNFSNTEYFQIRDHNVPANRLTISNTGNVGIGTENPQFLLDVSGDIRGNNLSPSDIRWKKDVHPLENSLSNVLKLQGVSYFWKTEEYPNNGFAEGKQIGLIAQEVEKVVPEVVHTDKEGYKSISYEKLTAVLVEAVKEQQKQNEDMQKRIEMQEKQIEELKAMVNNAIRLASVK